MALYRTVCLSFWTDPKVADDFTPEDRYFYLYLFTNPHTNLCGCYEVSVKQMANETGYSKDTIERLLDRFSNVHKVIDYSKDTKEVLLLNWHKYNWTKSEKFRISLFNEISDVKNDEFKRFLEILFNEEDTVSIRYPYGMDTSVTNTVYSNTNTSSNNSISSNTKYTSDKSLNTLLSEKPYSEDFKNSIGEWLKYKAEKKQSYKPTGFKQFLGAIDKKLKQYSEQQITDLMYLCMERNYQGLIWDLMKEVTKVDANSGNNQSSTGKYDDFAQDYFKRHGVQL